MAEAPKDLCVKIIREDKKYYIEFSRKNECMNKVVEKRSFKTVFDRPVGWDVGLDIVNKKYVFIRPAEYVFAKIKGIGEKIREKYGELQIAEYIVDYQRKIVYRPPKIDNPIKFRPIIFNKNGFKVVVGGWLA